MWSGRNASSSSKGIPRLYSYGMRLQSPISIDPSIEVRSDGTWTGLAQSSWLSSAETDFDSYVCDLFVDSRHSLVFPLIPQLTATDPPTVSSARASQLAPVIPNLWSLIDLPFLLISPIMTGRAYVFSRTGYNIVLHSDSVPPLFCSCSCRTTTSSYSFSPIYIPSA